MVMAAVCQPLAARPWKKLVWGRRLVEMKGLGIEAAGKGLDLVGIQRVGARWRSGGPR